MAETIVPGYAHTQKLSLILYGSALFCFGIAWSVGEGATTETLSQLPTIRRRIMRLRPCLLVALVLVLIGCQDAEQQEPDAVKKNPNQLAKPSDKDDEEQGQSIVTDHEPTHVVATDSVYYKDGPQQGRPPDGTFKAGTKVTLIEGAGSYSLVRLDEVFLDNNFGAVGRRCKPAGDDQGQSKSQ